MDKIWFAESMPKRGVCVASWVVDQEGNSVPEKSESRLLPSPDIVSDVHRLSFQAGMSQASSGSGRLDGFNSSQTLKESISGMSDSQMVLKLQLLIDDAKEAFQTVLARNSDLENKLEGTQHDPVHSNIGADTRRLSRTPSGLIRSAPVPRSASAVDRISPRVHQPVPRLVLPVRHQHVFDISTPPVQRDRITNNSLLLNGSSKLLRSDSGRIKRALSVHNS